MATVYQEYFGRFPIGATTDSFTVTNSAANALTLTAGYYYTDGYTGETAVQFCNHVQNIIRTATGSPNPNANVSYSHATGRVTIALDVACTIAWGDAALAPILGFSTDTTANAATHVGTQQPRYVWRPSVAASEYSTSLTGQTWAPVSTTKYRRANSGAIHSVPGSVLYETMFSYNYLPLADAIRAATQTYTSFQEWFEDVICNGYRVRFYRDRTLNSSLDVEDAMWGGEDPGRFVEVMTRNLQRFNGYWRVELPFWKWI